MTETTFHLNPETPPAVAMALARLYRSQERVRLWLGDPETGEAWPEECDVLGRVGRSTGERKVPLLVARRGAFGGGSILSAHVVRIDTTEGRTVYQHPTFTAGDWRAARGDEEDSANGTWCAMYNGAPWAGDLSEQQARNLCAFMRGDRYSK